MDSKVNENMNDLILRSAFILLLMTILTNILLANDSLPFGGSNVFFGTLTVLMSFLYTMINRKNIFPLKRNISSLILVSLALLLVAVLIYLSTDTLELKRLGTIGMGICMLFCVHLCVTNILRIKIVMLTIILATSLSALFGFCIHYTGEESFGTSG